MKKLSKENLSQIAGGCFCYCSTNLPVFYQGVRIPHVFVEKVFDEEACIKLCYHFEDTSNNLPYFGYSACTPDYIKLAGYVGENSIDKYLNGGWKVEYSY